MATKDRRLDLGTRRAELALVRLGAEIKAARQSAGLSQRQLGTAAGMSHSKAGRMERGKDLRIRLVDLYRAGAILGLDLAIQAHPAGPPLRDAAHVALLDRLRARLGSELTWRLEVPLPIEGDRRAWDALILAGHDPGARMAVEAETRLGDLQALLRRIALKRRDGGIDRVILLVNRTRANRMTLQVSHDLLAADFPIAARDALANLRDGRFPGGSAIVML